MIFGIRSVTSPRKPNSSAEIGRPRASLPVTVGAVNAARSPVASVNSKSAGATPSPSTAATKCAQYDGRRNSPSVTAVSPACSLKRHHVADRVVLQRAEVPVRQLPVPVAPERVPQRRRPQQAADVVSVERRPHGR